MTDGMDVSNRSVRENDPVLVFVFRLLLHCIVEDYVDPFAILWGDSFQERIARRWTLLGIESTNSEHFCRPVIRLMLRRVIGPTARVAQPLRFCKVSFAPLQSVLCQLALNGDSRQISDLFDDILIAAVRLPWFATVRCKCGEHFALGCDDRRGPTRAQTMGQRQFAIIGPQWICGDVFDDYLLSSVCGGPA